MSCTHALLKVREELYRVSCLNIFNVTLYTTQKTYDDSFIQSSFLFLTNDFHLMFSLDLSFYVFINYLLRTFTFCAVLVILNLQFF